MCGKCENGRIKLRDAPAIPIGRCKGRHGYFMKRQVLRLALGLGYVALVTLILLVQAGAGAESADRWIVFGEILLLGIPLAVVLILYVRLTDQMERHETAPLNYEENYEEQYARFLTVMQRTDRELSERELEVAWLLYRGYTNRQIGEELFIAETTVKKHVSHIYEKLEVSGRKEFKAMIYSDTGREEFSQ